MIRLLTCSTNKICKTASGFILCNNQMVTGLQSVDLQFHLPRQFRLIRNIRLDQKQPSL